MTSSLPNEKPLPMASSDSQKQASQQSDEELQIQQSQPSNDEELKKELSSAAQMWHRILALYFENEFLIHILMAIALARAYPPLGAEFLYPDITATWLAVCFIFVLAGLGLQTQEFSYALKQWKFNLLVQVFNFGVVSSAVYGYSRGLKSANIVNTALANGMVMTASVPMTINMVVVLTKTAGGNEAAAIFNAAFGNLLGVFLSPVLILAYLGVTADLDLFDVFYKLLLRVVLPVFVGQVLQKSFPSLVAFSKKHKYGFKMAQQYLLVFIVYTVFCSTFQDDNKGASIGDVFLMILFLFLFLVCAMGLAWIILRICFPNDPKSCIMGLFGCTHKTVAMGIPLVNAIYENDPDVGLYTLPLLIWHVMQLVLGTFLSPHLAAWAEREEARITAETAPPTIHDGTETPVAGEAPEVEVDENGDEKAES